MSAVTPVWRLGVRRARERTDRLTVESVHRVRAFEAKQRRLAAAAERAERAAIGLLQQQERLTRDVARPRW